MAVTILKPVLHKIFRMREEAGRRLPPGGDGPQAAEATQDPYEKPFLEHLEDLRIMFMKMIMTQLTFTIGCFVFHEHLFDFMFYPAESIRLDDGQSLREAIKMVFFSPPEAFMLSIKVSFLAGFILAFPFHSFFLAQFVLPGLTEKEKKYTVPGIFVGFLLFLTGASFSFFLALPYALKFLYTYGQSLDVESTWRIGYYLSFVMQVTLLFGLCFQLPLVVTILVRLQLLTYRTMKGSRSLAVIVLCVLSAVFTPPDPVTMIFMAVPMIILYEICIWIAYFMDKKREAREAEEEAAYQAWLEKEAQKEAGQGELPAETTTGAVPQPADPTPMADSGTDLASHDPYEEDPHHDWHDDHTEYDGHHLESEQQGGPDADEYECPEDRANRERARKARELAEAAERQAYNLIDINNALLEELKSLPGIGPVMAQKIIDHRPYGELQDLLQIPGFNQAKLDMIYAKVFAG